MENLISISTLQERYNLNSRQAVDDRIKGLGIQKPERGKISQDQLDKLDKLDKHLKSGGRIDNFAQPVDVEIDQVQPMLDNQNLSTGQLDKVQSAPDNFIDLVREIAAAMQPKVQRNPLDYFMDLEKAAANGWLLTSAEVKALIGVQPVVKKGDRSFNRGSFSFVKSGKIGSSTAWKVLKKV